MFDNLHVECEMPIKIPEDASWQTKDTPAQALDSYYLTKNKKLEYEAYDLEWEKDKDSVPKGYFRRKNIHRVFCEEFTGSINFYDLINGEWWEFCAFVEKGMVIKIITIDNPKGAEK